MGESKKFYKQQLDFILNQNFKDWDVLLDALSLEVNIEPFAELNRDLVLIKVMPEMIETIDRKQLEKIFKVVKDSKNFKKEIRAIKERISSHIKQV